MNSKNLAVLFLLFSSVSNVASATTGNDQPPEKAHGIILIEDLFTDRLGPFFPSHGQLMRDIMVGKYHNELKIKDKRNIRSWVFTLNLDVMKGNNSDLPPAEALKSQLPKANKQSIPGWLWRSFLDLPETLINVFLGPLDRPPVLNLDTESNIIIVNQSYILADYGIAKAILQEYIDRLPALPLFISAAGNDTNRCTEQAAAINRHIGSTEVPIKFYFFNEPQSACEQFYNACNLHLLAAQDLGLEEYRAFALTDSCKNC